MSARVLGLDLGQRRIGVALSDSLGLTAQRLTVIDQPAVPRAIDAVCALAAQHDVSAIVVGLPLTLRGERGVQARAAEAFAGRLRCRVQIPVHLMDERLTTVQGQRALWETGTSRRKQKEIIDQVAAQLILQQFLDAHRESPHAT